MKKYRIIFLLLSSIFFCSNGAFAANITADRDISHLSILGVDYSSLLFKANVKFYKYSFSGLILIKKLNADSSVNVALMSELGPGMLDLKYKNDRFEVVSCKEMFNRKKVINTLINDFRTVLQDLSYIKNYKIIEHKSGLGKLKIKHLSKRYMYIYEPDFYVKKIIKKGYVFNSLEVNIERSSNKLPDNIYFRHKGVNLKIELKLINIKN